MTYTHTPCAEVIESTLEYVIAQSWELNKTPGFGALVKCITPAGLFLGIVSEITTIPTDSFHQLRTYQKTYDELQREEPHIFAFLHTRFRVPIIGYSMERIEHQAQHTSEHKTEILAISMNTPPSPAPLHSFVAPACYTMQESILQSGSFLRRLAARVTTSHQFDELAHAIPYHAIQYFACEQRTRAYCEEYAQIIGNDYARIKVLCNDLQQLHRLSSDSPILHQ